MKRLPFVAIQQLGAAESASSPGSPCKSADLTSEQSGEVEAERLWRIKKKNNNKPKHPEKPPPPPPASLVFDSSEHPDAKLEEDEERSEPWSYIRAEEASASSQGRCDSLINNTGAPARCMNDCQRNPHAGKICEGPERTGLYRTLGLRIYPFFPAFLGFWHRA